jgi:hypothetical protein
MHQRSVAKATNDDIVDRELRHTGPRSGLREELMFADHGTVGERAAEVVCQMLAIPLHIRLEKCAHVLVVQTPELGLVGALGSCLVNRFCFPPASPMSLLGRLTA